MATNGTTDTASRLSDGELLTLYEAWKEWFLPSQTETVQQRVQRFRTWLVRIAAFEPQWGVDCDVLAEYHRQDGEAQ